MLKPFRKRGEEVLCLEGCKGLNLGKRVTAKQACVKDEVYLSALKILLTIHLLRNICLRQQDSENELHV